MVIEIYLNGPRDKWYWLELNLLKVDDPQRLRELLMNAINYEQF